MRLYNITGLGFMVSGQEGAETIDDINFNTVYFQALVIEDNILLKE